MKLLFGLLTIVLFFVSSLCQSQTIEPSKEKRSFNDLKTEILKTEVKTSKVGINSPQASKKSPVLAVLLSLVLPGAGHYYLDRMDVGKYFLGIDAASWIGLASLNVYGNSVRDDSRSFSSQHAGVENNDDKTDDFYASVGNYNNIYDYNNEMLTQGQYGKLYDVNKFYWDWDNTDNMTIYETQRKNSERIYNSRIIFGSILVANRIISGISSYLIASKTPDKKTSFNVQPELMYKNDYSFDGLKINLSKNF